MLFYALLNVIWMSNKNVLNQIKKEFRKLTELIEFKQSIYSLSKKEEYYDSCYKVFKKLMSFNATNLPKSPPRKPPSNLYPIFTLNGTYPISKYSYLAEVYPRQKEEIITKTVTRRDLLGWRVKVQNKMPLMNDDKVLQEIMQLFSSAIKGKTFSILGASSGPWIEAVAYQIGMQKIINIDYRFRNKYDTKTIEGHYLFDLLETMLKEFRFEVFDNAASYEIVGQYGLGRYGDPLIPDGDIDLVKMMHCILKPNALFFLALATSPDNANHIEFNTNRFYGSERLNTILEGWQLLAQKRDSVGNHTIFVLKKITFN